MTKKDIEQLEQFRAAVVPIIEAGLKSRVTMTELGQILFPVVKASKKHVADSLKPLATRVTTLESRGAGGADAKSHAMTYRGIWTAADEYGEGDACTLNGGIWVAQKTTRERPGTSDSWRLAAKSGTPGPRGPKGEPGPIPKHVWDGTKLSWENPDGTMSAFVDLQGPQGNPGTTGGLTAMGLPIGGGGGGSTAARGGWFPQGW